MHLQQQNDAFGIASTVPGKAKATLGPSQTGAVTVVQQYWIVINLTKVA